MKATFAIYKTLLLSFASIPLVLAQGTSDKGTGAQCVPYPGGVCSGYVDYDVYLPTTVTFEATEQRLLPSYNLTEWLSEIHSGCAEAYLQYLCPLYYPKCTKSIQNGTQTTSFQTGCLSACEAAVEECGTVFNITGNYDKKPDCSAVSPTTGVLLESSNCNSVAAKDPAKASHGLNVAAFPTGYVLSECIPPLVKDPLAKIGTNDTINHLYCRAGCCVPCPVQDYFYKEGYSQKGFLATDIVRIIGCVLSIFVLVSYSVLPDKRRHPTIIILFISISIFVFCLVAFFKIGDPNRVLCASDGIQQADQDNNILCGVQGALLIFASLANTMWCAVMIISLHLHTVWNSNFLYDKYILLSVLCWGIPAAIMSIALGLHAVKFEFSNVCLVKADLIMQIFFYPLAAIAIPAFLAHIATFFYIGKVAIKMGIQQDLSQSLSASGDSTVMAPQSLSRTRRHRHVVAAVKIQWRPLWLATIMVIAVVFYWLFYMVHLRRMTNLHKDPNVIFGWFGCMMDPTKTQNDCTVLVEPYLPPFPLLITAEGLVSIIGISLFLNFVKQSLLHEWGDLFYRIRVSIRSRTRVEKDADQFYAL